LIFNGLWLTFIAFVSFYDIEWGLDMLEIAPYHACVVVLFAWWLDVFIHPDLEISSWKKYYIIDEKIDIQVGHPLASHGCSLIYVLYDDCYIIYVIGENISDEQYY